MNTNFQSDYSFTDEKQPSVSNSITVIGESLIDRIQLGNNFRPGTVTDYVGGSPLNVAVGCARLGVQTRLVTQFGTDKFGEMITDHLLGNQVKYVSRSTTETSTATAAIEPDGSAKYYFSLNWDIANVSLPAISSIESSTHIHTGSIATMLMPGAKTVYSLVNEGKRTATISYDPNCRPTIISDAQFAREQTEQFIQVSDIVKASDEDIKWLYPKLSLSEVMENWLKLGPALIIITRGELGPVALTRSSRIEISPKDITVEDTIGAGDSFMSAVISALSQLDLLGSTNRVRLQSLTSNETTAILQYAVNASSITCKRVGANPPNLDDVGLIGTPLQQ